MLITLPPTCNKDKTKVKSREEEKGLKKKTNHETLTN